MSHGYQAVGWNRQKKIYDRVMLGGVAAFLVTFVGITLATKTNADPMVVLMRAFALCAFVLLHVILAIGPLARLDKRWLPWVYNRRHLGVTMFALAFIHSVLAMLYYHGFGIVDPLTSLFTGGDIRSLSNFPFQPLGFIALVILFLMAATSHDFWLAQLTPPVWKLLHMMVYVAYGLAVAHVVLGYLHTETGFVPAAIVTLGAVCIGTLHLITGIREFSADVAPDFPIDDEGYCDVLSVEEIDNNRGRIVLLGGDRVAVFHYDGKVSAISNACQHQNGPLGEGRVIDGLVTCPWHGFQYRPGDGCSPAPFTEKVPTFNVKISSGRIFVHPVPNEAGTPVTPALVKAATS